jgi:hypothetical protein
MNSKEDTADMTDDWMNPPVTSYSWTAPVLKNETEYIIERKHKTICFGSPGYITEWRFWSKFDTAEMRDSSYAMLQKEHPVWQLRCRDRNPYMESLGLF